MRTASRFPSGSLSLAGLPRLPKSGAQSSPKRPAGVGDRYRSQCQEIADLRDELKDASDKDVIAKLEARIATLEEMAKAAS